MLQITMDLPRLTSGNSPRTLETGKRSMYVFHISSSVLFFKSYDELMMMMMMMIPIFSAVCAYFASWLGHAFLQWIQALHRWQRRGNCFALLPLTKAALYSSYPFLIHVF